MFHSQLQRLLSGASNPFGGPQAFGFTWCKPESARNHVLVLAGRSIANQPRLGFATKSDKDKAAAQKLKEKEKAQKLKEKEKAQKEKEKEKERLRKEKEQKMKAQEKEKALRAKEKEKEKKEKEKEKLRKQKEKEKLKKETRTLKKSDGKPKRAPSPFNFFVKEKVPSLRLEHPKLSIPQLMSKASAQWKALDAAGRQKYEQENQRAKKTREEQLVAWKATLPPKKPPTGFAAFTKANFSGLKKENPNATIPEIGKILGQRWKSLSQSEKERYNK